MRPFLLRLGLVAVGFAGLAAAAALPPVHRPALSPRAQACADMRRAGIIPPGALAAVMGHPDGLGAAFLCRPPGPVVGGLVPSLTVLYPQDEDEPFVVVLARPAADVDAADAALDAAGPDPAPPALTE